MSSADHTPRPSGSHAPSDEQVKALSNTPDRHDVVAREKEQFGGMKLGSGFFGWLTATGMAVILLALLTAAGAIASNATGTSAGEAADQAASDPSSTGIAGGIALLVVLLLAYYCGGYVGGRMARFDGVKQGIAVWLWAVITTVVVAVLVFVAGNSFDVLSQLNLPSLPVSGQELTTGGIISLVLVVVVTLLGAIFGGLAGMRFHRKVDKAGLGR